MRSGTAGTREVVNGWRCAVRLRAATAQDWPGIDAVLAESWHQAYGADAVAGHLRTAQRLRDVIATPAADPDRRVTVAVHGDRIAGLVSTRRLALLDQTFIGMLYVTPDLQRRGIGRALVTHAAAQGPVRGGVCLQVLPQNARALAFYHAMGFQSVRQEWNFTAWRRVVVMERRPEPAGLRVSDLAIAA